MKNCNSKSMLGLLARNYLLLTVFVLMLAIGLLFNYENRAKELPAKPNLNRISEFLETHDTKEANKLIIDGRSIVKKTRAKSDGTKEVFYIVGPVSPTYGMEDAYRILQFGVFAAVIAYIVLIAIFALWTYRNVDRPLKVLDRAINAYETGVVPKLEYKGHKEFIELFDSFGKMANRLAESEKTRRKLEEDRSQLLANISHDLKTPVTVIAGYSKAICDNLIPDNEKQMYYDSIYQKSSHLSELITAFAEYSKLEHPEFKLHKGSCNFCEMIRAYLAGIYSEMEIEGFDLDADIPEEAYYCEVDQFQFARVLENIIGNALRYNQPGTKLLVKIAKNENGDRVSLFLGDNGSGIPKSIQKHIFEPFVVGDDARGTNQGSGLGLAVVKRIVDAHGGTISLGSRKDMKDWSTLFEIQLPIVEKENLTKF